MKRYPDIGRCAARGRDSGDLRKDTLFGRDSFLGKPQMTVSRKPLQIGSRKSQMTIFIIVGLLVLVITGLVLYTRQIATTPVERGIEEQFRLANDPKPVIAYIESCLRQESPGPIEEIGINGGSLSPAKTRLYDGMRYNFFCHTGHQEGCINNLLLRQDMESELALEIQARLSGCIDLTPFRKQDFEIFEGDRQVSVTIGRQEVIVSLNYPLRLVKGQAVIQAEDYSVSLAYPLGHLFETAVEITNKETKSGFYDYTERMSRNDAEILVEKHKPYPDTVYRLTEDGYEFLFAVEGWDTASDPGVSVFSDIKSMYGCCYNLKDQLCYENVPHETCQAKGGIYDFGMECSCPVLGDLDVETCVGRPCSPCEKTYDYTNGKYTEGRREHGESWCVYDSTTGKGFDFVGSRHYVHYCIDGKEYVEECRDFREELCTEEKAQAAAGQISKAACRPNRWQDCSSCTTEQCCENLEYRDCDWQGWLTTDRKCVPQVPVGFRHWEMGGQDICSLSNQYKECQGLGFSCPDVWTDDAAILCYKSGDCGNYRNIRNKMTYEGFLSTDATDTPRPYVYLEGEYASTDYSKVGNNEEVKLKLGIGNRGIEELYGTPYAQAPNRIAELITVGYNYLNYMSGISISDFLNPFTPMPQIKVVDFSFCDPWQAPDGGADCSSCNSDDNMRPCTEYRCMSLGKTCRYAEQDGKGVCQKGSDNDKKGPVIEVDEDSVSGNHELKKKSLNIASVRYEGYEIVPELKPYKLFKLSIKTSEESVCTLTYLPRTRLLRLPAFGFSSGGFSTEHNMSFRVPPRTGAPKKILDALQVEKLDDIVGMLEQPKDTLENYQSIYAEQIWLYNTVTGQNIISRIEPVVRQILDVIAEMSDMFPFYKSLIRTMMQKFDAGGYYFFIECRDRAGNYNEDEFFLEATIDDLSDDDEPPLALGFLPENGSYVSSLSRQETFNLFLDEPSECRYSYEDKNFENMEHELKCPETFYHISPQFDGSYRCIGTMNMTEGSQQVFIKCRDNPQEKVIYKLRLTMADTAQVIGKDYGKFLNVSRDNIINASANTLREPVDIAVSSKQPVLNLFLEEEYSCSYLEDGRQKGMEDCVKNERLELGQYLCRIGLDLTKQSGIAVTDISFALEIDYNDTEATISEPAAGIRYASPDLGINLSLLSEGVPIVRVNSSHTELMITGPAEGLACNYGLSEDAIDTPILCIENRCGQAFSTPEDQTFYFSCRYEEEKTDAQEFFDYNISCKKQGNIRRNENSQSIIYHLEVSSPLMIISITPDAETAEEQPMLVVETTKSLGTICTYYMDSSLGERLLAKEEKNDRTMFSAKIPDAKKGVNTYKVRCRDQFQNSVEKRVDFYVI